MPTFNDLFTLSTDDYAVGLLGRVFGGVVTYVTGEGGALTDGTLLTNLIAVFNKMALLMALVVGSYTTYVMIFDTAADGRTFGSSADTKYTILRALVGAIAFVPLSGGLTLAQLLLVWLTVQGSALGDVAWHKVADSTLRAQPVLEAKTPLATTDFLVKKQFANALYALTNGELCMMEMNRLGNLADPHDPAKVYVNLAHTVETHDVSRPLWYHALPGGPTTYESRTALFYFTDTAGSYGKADNLCGSVFFQTEFQKAAVGGSTDFATKVGAAVYLQQFQSAYSAVMNDLRPAATNIAANIMSGDRDRKTIETLMQNAVNAAFANYMSGVSSGALSASDYDTLHQDLLDEVDKLGWAFAVSWQRGITMAAQAADYSASDFEIVSKPENHLNEYFSGLGAWLSGRSSGVSSGMFTKPKDDFGYLGQFSGFINELGTYQPTAVTTVTNAGDAENSGVIRAAYQSILETFSATKGGMTAGYLDPMADIMSVGKGVTTTGAIVMGAGAVIQGSGRLLGPLTSLVVGPITDTIAKDIFYPVGWTLLAAGFVLISIIPAIPLVYFFAAVISWLMLAIESMFAIPLAVLTYFAPARDSTLIGPWNKIILNLFGIMLRPIFTIIGFIGSMIMMRLGLDFLFTLFAGFLGFMTAGGSWFSLLIAVGLVFVYLVVILILVMQASSLIIELGDAAMNWIGIGMSNLGRLDIGSRTADMTNPHGGLTRVMSSSPSGLIGGGRRALKSGRERLSIAAKNTEKGG